VSIKLPGNNTPAIREIVMHSRRCLTQPLFILLSVYVLSPLLSGCTVVGPTAVHSGRLAYNEAIIKTDNQ